MLRPLRPCLEPECPHLTRSARGCPQHQRRHREVYNSLWERFAVRYLAAHPVCEQCRLRRAQHVHHLDSVALHPDRRLDPTNAQAVCIPCHRRETPTVRH